MEKRGDFTPLNPTTFGLYNNEQIPLRDKKLARFLGEMHATKRQVRCYDVTPSIAYTRHQ
jgi:hypothetical protein